MKKHKLILLVLLLLLVQSSQGLLSNVSASTASSQYVSGPNTSLPLKIMPSPRHQEGYYTLSEAEEKPKDEDDVIQSLRAIVEEYLKKEEYEFEYNSEYEFYSLFMEIKGFFQIVECYIFLYDDLVSLFCMPSYWYVPEEARNDVAKFITLVNYDSFYAFFTLEYDGGELISRSTHLVESGLPTTAEIETIMATALQKLEDYGDAIRAITNENQDPLEVYKNREDYWP